MHFTPSLSLAELAQQFWAFRCYEEPVLAIQAGERLADAALFRDGPHDYERRVNAAKAFLTQLNAIAESNLPSQDRATHQLLRRELEDIFAFNEVRAHERPVLFPFGPELNTVDFANTVALTTIEAAELYVERLCTIPAYFGDVIANLVDGHAFGLRYPRQVIASAVAAVGAHISGALDDLPWFSPFRRTVLVGKDIERLAQATREMISKKLVPALQAYAAFLEGPLSIGARDSISCADCPDGDQFYRVLVRHFTTTEMTPSELHQLGKSEVARLTAEMQDVAAEAGFKDSLQRYRHFLASDPQFIAVSKESLRERFEILSKRIDLKIPSLFGRVPRITYGVQTIPEEIAALLPPAYAQVNPADGSGPGVHWVTSLPHKAPSFMHIPLALHEAWPGHLMHMALMQELTELPAFRRFGGAVNGAWRYAVCLEGWALYAESLGIEMGLYDTPHLHYGRLDMEMWRAVRLVVDTGIHAKGWGRGQALEYMTTNLALPRTTTEAELDRYIGMPAQALAYHVGNLKFRELRHRAEQRLGKRFDIRAFHDVLMSAGPVTLPVLEQLVEDYLQTCS
jgi:uncharacterized protein (DUF885 family)